MAYRGRGRGFGRGGGSSFRFVKQEPFVLFPEIEDLPIAEVVDKEKALVYWSSKLQKFWNTSPYFLKDEGPKEDLSADIERFSDRSKRMTEQKRELSDFIKCSVEYVPAELANRGSKRARYGRKVQWNQESDLQKLDLFEKREQGQDQDEDEKDGTEKKEEENEEDDDEKIEEDDEEYMEDGDYNQNEEFDDDEDDFNKDDDNDDEGIF